MDDTDSDGKYDCDDESEVDDVCVWLSVMVEETSCVSEVLPLAVCDRVLVTSCDAEGESETVIDVDAEMVTEAERDSVAV